MRGASASRLELHRHHGILVALDQAIDGAAQDETAVRCNFDRREGRRAPRSGAGRWTAASPPLCATASSATHDRAATAASMSSSAARSSGRSKPRAWARSASSDAARSADRRTGKAGGRGSRWSDPSCGSPNSIGDGRTGQPPRHRHAIDPRAVHDRPQRIVCGGLDHRPAAGSRRFSAGTLHPPFEGTAHCPAQASVELVEHRGRPAEQLFTESGSTSARLPRPGCRTPSLSTDDRYAGSRARVSAT